MATVTPEIRARVIELAREGQSCRSIAGQLGVSLASVSRITSAEGLYFAQRARTEQATAARSARIKERRAVLVEESLDAVEIAMATLAEADTAREVQQAAIALDRAASAHLQLVRAGVLPEPIGSDHGKSVIGQIHSELRQFLDVVEAADGGDSEAKAELDQARRSWAAEAIRNGHAVEITPEQEAEFRRVAGMGGHDVR
ncbi:MAG TPA: helix-turn-helix domain-containing protein [Jiangellaceae bacterium]|nr:helix-turn-helix domain-containing protein [Jiangellaceae bacterium]